MKKKLAKKAVGATTGDEGCDTVEKSLEELGKLKKYGFSEEELKYKLATKGNIIKVTVHSCLFKVLRDFSKNNLNLPEAYEDMRTKTKFRKKGNTISIKKGLKLCYAPSFVRILIAQFIEKFRKQREEEKKSVASLIVSTKKDLFSRVTNELAHYMKIIKRIDHHFYKPDKKYRIIIWFKRLERIAEYPSLNDAIQDDIEIYKLLSLFTVKKVRSEIIPEQSGSCCASYEILKLKVELVFTQEEAQEKNLMERGIRASLTLLLEKFV